MDFRTVQLPQVKITAAPAPEYEAFLIVIPHSVKQAETLYKIRGLIAFAAAAFQNGILMNLAVMAPYFLLVKIIPQRLCLRMPADASRIHTMCFRQAVPDAGIFREITISQAYIRMQLFQLVIESPAHDPHERSISKTHTSFDRPRKFYRPFVISLMAGFTERDTVIRRITSSLSAFNMVYIENFVFRLPFAALADMAITEQYIFTYIPAPELFPLLVLCALDIRVLDLLDIKGRYLHNDF